MRHEVQPDDCGPQKTACNLSNNVRDDLSAFIIPCDLKTECNSRFDVSALELPDGIDCERDGEPPSECNHHPVRPLGEGPFQIDVGNDTAPEEGEYRRTNEFCKVNIHC